jgi:3-oxoadipate enol-lactonase
MAKTVTAKARDGCELSYEIRSRPGKPRVVLIHSLAMNRAIWDEVVDQIRDEAEILLYDCRGHGKSDRRPGPYTVDQALHDAIPGSTLTGISTGRL